MRKASISSAIAPHRRTSSYRRRWTNSRAATPGCRAARANMSSISQSAAGSTAEVPFPPPAVGWYATGILAFLYWLSLLDRQIIALLVDPIKKDLGLTDVQFSILLGVAFVGSFTLFGLVF